MKLLQVLAYILPKKWFVALLASKYCKSIRLRLLSRSYNDINFYICLKLLDVIYNTFNINLSIDNIQYIFKMNYLCAVNKFGAHKFPCSSWWHLDDPNRQKYHTYLFLIQ